MFFAENLKRDVWIASRSVNDDGVSIYGTPVKYTVSCYTVLPTSASADLKESGTRYTGYMQLVGDPEYLKSIKRLDKVYVWEEPPQTNDQLASTADYIVHRIVVTPMCTTVVLRLLGDD